MTRIAPGSACVIPANPQRTRLAVTARDAVYLTAPDNFPGEAAIIAPGETFVFGDGTPVPLGVVMLANRGQRTARVTIDETTR